MLCIISLCVAEIVVRTARYEAELQQNNLLKTGAGSAVLRDLEASCQY